MNFMIYPLGCLAFWVYGFALGWGNWWNGPVGAGMVRLARPRTVGAQQRHQHRRLVDMIGTKGFFLGPDVVDTGVMAIFFFMMVFMDTTATIPTGAMAERWAWKNFMLYGLWVALPYCIYANWVWGGGWLAQAGLNWASATGRSTSPARASSTRMGGIIGLAGAMVSGRASAST